MRKDEFPIVDKVVKDSINEVLEKIRAEISDLDDADYDYEGYYKAVTDAVKIIDKYKAESEDLGDYPDTIHNQFDNMTGSMNL